MSTNVEIASVAGGLPRPEPQACLSALVDGDASAVQQACAQWRDDPQARARWHTYHLIGDVMRSDELAVAPAQDSDFLAALRVRLAAEPVVLAPSEPNEPKAAPSIRRRAAWLMPAAAAAGFVVVAGVLVVARIGTPGAAVEGSQLASTQSRESGDSVRRVSQTDIGGTRARPSPVLSRTDGFIRDARLDEYLRVHQSARGGIAVAQPGGIAVAQPGGTMHRVDRVETAVPVSAER